MTTWDTAEGGPCFFRPTQLTQKDNPIYKNDKSKLAVSSCVETNGKAAGLGFKVRAFFSKKKHQYINPILRYG